MEALPESMFCNYQYVLTVPAGAVNEDNKLESMIGMLMFRNAVETDNPTAEKFTAYSLHTEVVEGIKDEDISIYGISPDSKYLHMDFKPGEVYVSSVYQEKWMLDVGDTIRLKEIYGDEEYEFKVGGVYPYIGGLVVFMDQDEMNEIFDFGEDAFTGYFSDTEITDIDEKYIGQVIDFESMSKVSRQLDISMGGMMHIVSVFAVIMFMILIYLLSKTIIEKNASSISMTKILGYSTGEIGKLYVMVTSILIVIFIIITIPLESVLMTAVFRVAIRMEMAGWIPFILSGDVYIKMFVYGIITYAIVAVFEYRKIGKVPMDEALKNVE
jgi:putative ABC transport system permease protein